MRNPFFVSRPFQTSITGTETAFERFTRTGSNTGNLLFIHTLKRAIRHDRYMAAVGFNPHQVRTEHDGLVIPAANWLSNHTDWGGLGDKIAATQLPCIMVGLGAQSLSTDRYPKLKPGTERLVRIVAERCKTISVRGEYSAEVLAHYGITNVRITGCPSLLWNVDHVVSLHKPDRRLTAVSVCGTRGDQPSDLDSQRERDQLSLLVCREAARQGFDYIAQTEVPDMRIACGDLDDPDEREHAIRFLKRAYAISRTDAVTSYVTAHVKTFFFIPDWLRYLRTRDFVVGTRLHGVIASLIAGTPALLLTHDTRTTEAAAFMGLPSIDGREVLQCGRLDIDALYARADIDAFNRRMPAYYANFRTFFEENSVAHCLAETVPQTLPPAPQL